MAIEPNAQILTSRANAIGIYSGFWLGSSPYARTRTRSFANRTCICRRQFQLDRLPSLREDGELLSSGREAFELPAEEVTFFVIDLPNDLLSRLVGALAPTLGVFDPQALHLVDRSEPLACEWLGLDIRIGPKNYSPTDEHCIRHHALGIDQDCISTR